jgi:hypothetical protein
VLWRKTHKTDSQNSDTTASSGRELYHLQFSLQAASPETFGYTVVLHVLVCHKIWNYIHCGVSHTWRRLSITGLKHIYIYIYIYIYTTFYDHVEYWWNPKQKSKAPFRHDILLRVSQENSVSLVATGWTAMVQLSGGALPPDLLWGPSNSPMEKVPGALSLRIKQFAFVS